MRHLRLQRLQRGVVLVITLIMLLLVTLMGTVSANLIQTNLKIVDNIEARSAARNAALTAIQEAIVTPGFLEGTKAFVVSCNSDTYSRCLDLTGNNIEEDIVISLSQPQCITATPVRNAELDVFGNAEDASCYQPGRYSLCADALWEFDVQATDSVTGASVQIRQGVETRTSVNLLASACGN